MGNEGLRAEEEEEGSRFPGGHSQGCCGTLFWTWTSASYVPLAFPLFITTVLSRHSATVLPPRNSLITQLPRQTGICDFHYTAFFFFFLWMEGKDSLQKMSGLFPSMFLADPDIPCLEISTKWTSNNKKFISSLFWSWIIKVNYTLLNFLYLGRHLSKICREIWYCGACC